MEIIKIACPTNCLIKFNISILCCVFLPPNTQNSSNYAESNEMDILICRNFIIEVISVSDVFDGH